MSNTAPLSPLKRIAWIALDTLLPPQCLGCGSMVTEAGILCPDCWERVTFLNPPQCDCCGFPFAHDHGRGALCGSCIRHKPVFSHARAAMIYNEYSRNLILAFKHGDRTDTAPALAKWLLRAGSDLFVKADLIIPVPLHWRRLFGRRYNQAAILANILSDLTGLPVVPDVLVRTRYTPSQGFLSYAQRHRNLQGAFGLKPRKAKILPGKRIILIDDVFTTGATVSACSRILLSGGAESVDVLTLARVMKTTG